MRIFTLNNFIALLFVAGLAVCVMDETSTPPSSAPKAPSNAQSPSAAQKPAVTYFLIDASGSMEKLDAEKEVSKILGPIVEHDKMALVSRTYFRAANPEACRAKVEISKPVPAGQSTREFPKYHADFTPTGEALKAAILRAVASGIPANIYLVSDEEPTAGCGVDVCSVASAMLPIDNVVVRSLPVFGTNLINHDRLGCIEAAQRKPQETASPGNNGESEADGGTKSVTFLEKWSWLLLFGTVALSALAIGFAELQRSVALTEKIEKVESYNRLIAQGDAQAKIDLDLLLKSEPDLLKQPEPENALQAFRKSFRRSWFALKFWYLWFGGLGLLYMAMVPPDYGLSNYRLGVAQRSAWEVLDTHFAEAFAFTWAALIFFWGSQYQRRKEVEHKFLLVVKEEERVRSIQDTKAREETKARAERSYWSAHRDISNISLDPPWDVFRSYGDGAAFRESFNLVAEEAIELALGEKLSDAPTVDEFTAKTKKLTELIPRFRDRHNFTKFVARLFEERYLMDKDAEWKDLLSTLTADDRTDEKVRIGVRHLAEKLQT